MTRPIGTCSILPLLLLVAAAAVAQDVAEQQEPGSWTMARDDGSDPVQHTRGEDSASNPAFSPDGRQLAFTTPRSGTNQVWIMDWSERYLRADEAATAAMR